MTIQQLGKFGSAIVLLTACSTTSMSREPSADASSGTIGALNYTNGVTLASHKGNTFFDLVNASGGIKSRLDALASDPSADKQNGFAVDPDMIDGALANVATKVKMNAFDGVNPFGTKQIDDVKSTQNLKTMATNLAAGGKYSVYSLGTAIQKEPTYISIFHPTAQHLGPYFDIATFLELASGGGVAVQLADSNVYYNVGYGTGKVANDEETGRSFGESPGKPANDASDSFYLQQLESLVKNSSSDLPNFYTTLLQILTDCDSSGYASMKNDTLAQEVSTLFFAIYTAEQDRHLMSGLKTHNWDSAILEVTLLSALAAGQEKIEVVFQGKMTPQVIDQNTLHEKHQVVMRQASIGDWWQYSKTAGSNQSGINETRGDFGKLGQFVTAYESQPKNHPELVNAIQQDVGLHSGNVFDDLANYLISFKAPTSLGNNATKLTSDFVAFLKQVKIDAPAITAYAEQQTANVKPPSATTAPAAPAAPTKGKKPAPSSN